jgi:hypothetical protein
MRNTRSKIRRNGKRVTRRNEGTKRWRGEEGRKTRRMRRRRKREV